MGQALVDVLNGIGALRGLMLLVAAGSAWRAVHLFHLDDGRNPLPWAFALIICLAVLALVSL